MKTLIDKVTLAWLRAAAIRAARTMAQTALGMLTIGAAISEINWVNVLSVAFVSGLYSVLTSVATKLPEVEEIPTDGTLQIDTTSVPSKYRFAMDKDFPELVNQEFVTLKVDPNADLSQ
jgi:hypothetical protein